MGSENALYIILIEKIKQDALVLPALPEVALKVREAADNPDINLMNMSEIISQDAALSLGMIKVANSAAFSRAVKVDSVAKAVTRIGLRQIKSIATAMAIEQMFISDNQVISEYMQDSWRQTVDIASVAIALMTLYIQKNKQSPLRIETLTLAALIHNIGVLPILNEAKAHPEVFANAEFLERAITKFSNEIAVEMTKAWDFSEDFREVVKTWNDLSVLPQNAHYIDFIRAGAVYHEVFKNNSTRDFLLESYVEKGILPELNFMESETFLEILADTKSMF